jgi:hypothetical protein
MKKLLVVLFVLLLVSPVAFAMQCKEGNDSSDECWTQVKIDSGYTTLVSRGHILVVSVQGKDVNANDGYLATNSYDQILGVAQKSIASGESALILVRGRGEVKIDDANVGGSLASGDPLSNLASGSAVEASPSSASNDKAKVGLALQSGASFSAESTGKAKRIYAYIDV